MDMPQRTFGSSARYGFNGKERDKDMHSLTAYDYGFRIYNPAIARFLSVDPLTESYPWYTPYQFAGNMPVWSIDVDGLEEMKANSVANIIKDINGNIITTPTKIYDPTSSADIIPGVRRLDAGFIEVTPGLTSGNHPFWNTFIWSQKVGVSYECLQTTTAIGQEAGGTPRIPPTVQNVDDGPIKPPTNTEPELARPIDPCITMSGVKTTVNKKYASDNYSISLDIDFHSAGNEYGGDAKKFIDEVGGETKIKDFANTLKMSNISFIQFTVGTNADRDDNTYQYGNAQGLLSARSSTVIDMFKKYGITTHSKWKYNTEIKLTAEIPVGIKYLLGWEVSKQPFTQKINPTTNKPCGPLVNIGKPKSQFLPNNGTNKAPSSGIKFKR